MPRRKKNCRGRVQIERNGDTGLVNGHSQISLNTPKSNIKIENVLSESYNSNGPILNGSFYPQVKIEETEELEQATDALTPDEPKSVIKVEKNEAKELRRTSRKMVPKTNFIINPKPDHVKKYKRGRKSVSASDPLKFNGGFKRGPGRPRKADPFPMWPLALTNAKEKVPDSENDNHVWTLVPKTLVDSEYFKSHIIKMHYPHQPSKPLSQPRQPSMTSSQPRLSKSMMYHDSVFKPNQPSARQKMERLFNYPGFPIGQASNYYKETESFQKASTRPTVIYFRPSKENVKASEKQNRDVVPMNYWKSQNGHSFCSEDQNSSEAMGCWNSPNEHSYSSVGKSSADEWNWNSLNRQSFSCKEQFDKNFVKDSIVCEDTKLSDYAYGNANGKLADVHPQNHFVEEYDGYCKVVRNPPLNTSSANPVTGSEVTYLKDNKTDLEPVPFMQPNLRLKTEVDTLCRQVIVDSLKILYSNEAVLG